MPVITDEIEELESIEEQNASVETSIMEAFNSGDGSIDWRIDVSRLNGAGQKESRLFSINPSELETLTERLLNNHGTGEYRARVRRNRVLFKQFDLSVEAPRVAAAQSNGTELALVLKGIQEQNAAFRSEMMQFMERNSRTAVPTVDPMESMMRYGTFFKTLFDSSRPPPQPEPGMNAIELITKGMEFGREIAERAGGESSMGMEVLNKIIPEIPSLIAAYGQARANSPAPVTTSAPQEIPLPKPQIAPAVTTVNPQLKQLCDYLLGKARAGGNAELYAEWTLAEVAEPMRGTMMARPLLYEELSAMVPEIKEQETWFRSLVAEMRSLYYDNDAGTGTNTPPRDNGGTPERDRGGAPRDESHEAGDPNGEAATADNPQGNGTGMGAQV